MGKSPGLDVDPKGLRLIAESEPEQRSAAVHSDPNRPCVKLLSAPLPAEAQRCSGQECIGWVRRTVLRGLSVRRAARARPMERQLRMFGEAAVIGALIESAAEG
jgi:hypothetical protein